MTATLLSEWSLGDRNGVRGPRGVSVVEEFQKGTGKYMDCGGDDEKLLM